jgi:cation diffusion facilitator family transporter
MEPYHAPAEIVTTPNADSAPAGDAHAPVADEQSDRRALSLAMTLSLAIGFLMLALKAGAYLLTDSAAILSDAAESVVHLAAVSFAFFSLRLSWKPADELHRYGHAKISFFSAGFEGGMILLAALFIIYESLRKWLTGLELEHLGLGTGLTALAMGINGGLGWFLVWTGKRHQSLILIANGKHVLTDCWTSLGVIAGLGLALATGWLPWDPIAAILVALNIIYSGLGLIRASFRGLMDAADPHVEQHLVAILDRETAARGIRYHDLRHRSLGSRYWVEVHLLFSQSTRIGEAHLMATEIENTVASSLKPRAYVTTHLEAIEDHDDVHTAGEH